MFVSRCETRIVCAKYSEIGFEVRVSVRVRVSCRSGVSVDRPIAPIAPMKH